MLQLVRVHGVSVLVHELELVRRESTHNVHAVCSINYRGHATEILGSQLLGQCLLAVQIGEHTLLDVAQVPSVGGIGVPLVLVLTTAVVSVHFV